MKKVTVTFKFDISEKNMKNKEYIEFQSKIESGKFDKDMSNNNIGYTNLNTVMLIEDKEPAKPKDALYCIEVKRGGVGEEDLVLHHSFEGEPTRDDVLKFVLGEEIGYDDDHCKFKFYPV